MTTYKTKDRVRITYLGRTVSGVVSLASSNGRSLFLSFDAMLGGHVGGMPVLQDEGGESFRSLITSELVELAAERGPL